MYPVFVLLGLLILAIWLVVKLLKSAKFDKWVKDLCSGKVNTESPKDIIKDITKDEDVLGKKVEKNKEVAKKLTEESSGITDFLGRKEESTEKEGS